MFQWIGNPDAISAPFDDTLHGRLRFPAVLGWVGSMN